MGKARRVFIRTKLLIEKARQEVREESVKKEKKLNPPGKYKNTERVERTCDR